MSGRSASPKSKPEVLIESIYSRIGKMDDSNTTCPLEHYWANKNVNRCKVKSDLIHKCVWLQMFLSLIFCGACRFNLRTQTNHSRARSQQCIRTVPEQVPPTPQSIQIVWLSKGQGSLLKFLISIPCSFFSSLTRFKSVRADSVTSVQFVKSPWGKL